VNQPDYVIKHKKHSMALVLHRDGPVDLMGDLSVPEIIKFLRFIADDLEANGLPRDYALRPAKDGSR
jgi:hypothetical protein